nr:hypothetical protein BaRGS_007393 [Batillaria attramentaria]
MHEVLETETIKASVLRHSLKQLPKSTDTTQKTKEQKDQNVSKKKELDDIQEKLMHSEGQLDTVRKGIRRYETSRAKLEGEERALAAQLSKQLKLNDQMRIKGLQSAKEDLNTKAEEVGTMQMETMEMQEEIEALGESHKTAYDDQSHQLNHITGTAYDDQSHQLNHITGAVLAQLTKQIEEYKEQLSRERKERLELQSKKDNVSKNLDDLKTEAASFMSEMTGLVQGSKKKHSELSNEGIQLQKDLKENEQKISGLSKDLSKAQDTYNTTFTDYQKRLATIEEEVLNLERASEDKTKELEEKTPIFHELEKYFDQRTAEYDARKKEIVALKNKKQGLEDGIKRTNRDKEQITTPQAALREELKAKRTALMHKMKSQGTTTQTKEQEIFEQTCKLRAVVEENEKFGECCEKLEEELADVQQQMVDNEKSIQLLQAELVKQKGELMKKWETDAMMQEFFASRDEATAEAFGRLLDRTGKRENKIDKITEQLSEELQVLAGFLDNIAARRPQANDDNKA